MENSVKKVIWSFDPYTDIAETWDRSLEAIKALRSKADLEIVPVYVMGADQLDWVGHLEPPQLDHVEPYVRKAVTSRLNQLDVTTSEPVILKNPDDTRKSDIQTLLSFVEKEEGDLILVNTHARQGVVRFFVGSFAETLALQSKVPVLFVSPQCRPIKSLEHVLFPSNLSASSFQVFKTFLNQYGDRVSQITVLSKVLRPINAFAESSITAMGGSWIAPEQYLAKEMESRNETAKEWTTYAEGKGLKASVFVDDELGDVSESVDKFSKENDVDLTVVGSFATQAEAFFIGSIGRQVIRQSDIPVMIYHKED